MSSGELNRLPSKVVIWGGTGQARIVRPIIEHYQATVVAVFDDSPGLSSPFEDVPIYFGYEGFSQWIEGRDRKEIGFCVAIGNPNGRARLRLHDLLVEEGLRPITIAHPTAWIEHNVIVGAGTQIMAGAIITTDARIGRQCIINTKASVDHDCVLEEGVEVSPGATLCGNIHVGVNAWIGAGATVLPWLSVGVDAIVGGGAVVTKDVPAGVTVVGVPAKPMSARAVSRHKEQR